MSLGRVEDKATEYKSNQQLYKLNDANWMSNIYVCVPYIEE